MDIQITWLGHSAFLLNFDGYRVLLDPYLTGNDDAAITPDQAEADLILVSHGHHDHVGDTVELAQRLNVPVVSNPEVLGWLAGKGVRQTLPLYISGQRKFPFGTLKAVSAAHGSSMPDKSYGGLALGFILNAADGRKIYFAGDTGLFGDMRLIGEEGIDVALLPIGDIYVLGLSESIRALNLIQSKLVIPMHYHPGLDLTGWEQELQRISSTKPVILKPGETFLLK